MQFSRRALGSCTGLISNPSVENIIIVDLRESGGLRNALIGRIRGRGRVTSDILGDTYFIPPIKVIEGDGKLGNAMTHGENVSHPVPHPFSTRGRQGGSRHNLHVLGKALKDQLVEQVRVAVVMRLPRPTIKDA